MATPVVALSTRKALAASRTGGKGAGLARLARAGFPVPPGFVLTTRALRAPLETARRLAVASSMARVPASALHATPESLAAARRFCLDWPVPDRLSRALLEAFLKLGGSAVAVRSSLVAEDSRTSSCAGLLDTVLDVTDADGLHDAVRQVLASAFSERLWTYLRESGATPPRSATTSLAVVVQTMVNGLVSGVAFSLDPVTCRPGVVIEATPGRAADLVRGRVLPDRYRFGPRGDLEEAHPAVPGSPCLDEARARELASLVTAVTRSAGVPQDVEWSFDGRRIHLLQTRPITSNADRVVYSRRMVSDMAPGVVKPLVWSAKYAPINENVFAPIFRTLAGSRAVDTAEISVRLYSRVYVNVTSVGQLLRDIGLPPNFFEMMGRDDLAAPAKPRLNLRTALALGRLARFARRESRIDRRVRPFLDARHRALAAFRRVTWDDEAPLALLAHIRTLARLHGRSQWHIVLVSMNMQVRHRLLARVITKRWPGADPREVIRGYGRRSNFVPFEEIEGLAAEARLLPPGLLDVMTGDGGPALRAALIASDEGRRLLERFDAFMDRFGFLSGNGSDFSEPPWNERPQLIWHTIGRLARSRTSSPTADAATERETALRRVRSGLGPVRRRLFDRLHASTVRYMDCRDRLSVLMTEETWLMRQAVLALGRTLARRDVIEAPEDIFYLFESEIDPLISNTDEARGVRDRIAQRKAETARHAALEPPDTLCGREPADLEPPAAVGDMETLSGIGASAGVRTGRARVVRDPTSADGRLGPSDILIVPFTDIGWCPILAGIGGVVAETGGQLSHTSIIAREFGIPAVVSVPNAVHLIPDGRLVTIDGTAGRVYLHPEPTPGGLPT